MPPVRVPVMLAVPVILAPVPVMTTTFATPPTEVLTLPFAAGILTLDVPFARVVPIGILSS